MQALNVVDCPAEQHLLHDLVKVKKIWQKRPSHASVETRVSYVGAGMVCGRKRKMMI